MRQKRKAEYLPFLAVGIVAVLWHATLKIGPGDDIVYFQSLMDGRSIFEILAHRYQTWSSRLAIEAVLIPIVHCPLLWRIADIAVYTTVPVLLCRLLDITGTGRWYTAALVLLYPFSDMVSAGWISTTTNYLWPLWCTLFLGTLVKKMHRQERIAPLETAGGILACIYAGSQEQAAVILLFLFVSEILFSFSKKRFKMPLLYVICGINIISLISILLCPGNAIRTMQETEGRMPEFAGFSVWEKLYMGLVNVERIFIANLNSVFFVTTAVLALLVYLKTKDYKKTLISALPVLLLFGQAVVRVSHPWFEELFVVPTQATSWDWKDFGTYLPLLFLAICIIGLLYALRQLSDGSLGKYFWTLLLLGAGLATGVVMGFSPTIYASADRPYIFLYFILIYVCLERMWALRGVVSRGLPLCARKLAFTVLMLLVLVNVADVWRICYIMGRQM